MKEAVGQAHVKSHIRVMVVGIGSSTVWGWIDNNMVHRGETDTSNHSHCGYCDWSLAMFPRIFYNKRPLHQTTFPPEDPYTKTLTQKTFTSEDFCSRGNSNERAFTPEAWYTRRLLQQNASTPEIFYTKQLLRQNVLKQETFTPKHVYTRNHFQQKPFTQGTCYTKDFLHQKAFAPEPQRTLCTRSLLHQKPFPPEAIWTKNLLHKKLLQQRQFEPKTFHKKNFYSRSLLHQNAFAQTLINPPLAQNCILHARGKPRNGEARSRSAKPRFGKGLDCRNTVDSNPWKLCPQKSWKFQRMDRPNTRLCDPERLLVCICLSTEVQVSIDRIDQIHLIPISHPNWVLYGSNILRCNVQCNALQSTPTSPTS